MIRNGGGDDDDGHHCLHSKKVVFILPLYTEAPRFAHRVGRRLRGLLSRWVTVGLNDLRSPPTLSDDSRDFVTFFFHQAGRQANRRKYIVERLRYLRLYG